MAASTAQSLVIPPKNKKGVYIKLPFPLYHLYHKLEENKGYLRKRIGVKDKQEDIYLTNGLLRGRVDEVLTLRDDTMAPLDYKFARYEGKL
ncbi:MAG: hypothetical protein WBG62_07070, partial [Cyclobacteriaceae bacterium]